MWEEVARKVREMGGTIVMEQSVRQIHARENRVTARDDGRSRREIHHATTAILFSPPCRSGIWCAPCRLAVPANVQEVSEGLMYRDFITVGLLLEDLKIKDQTQAGPKS